MAYREYVGSRYVPIFGRKDETSIQWDNTGTYEPLTVVLYQGNSYTSRQFVPVGIDITNEEYWAQTGNYNAQVEQYRQEVYHYDERIESVEHGLIETNETITELSELVNGQLIVRTSGSVQGTSVLVSADDEEFVLIDAGTVYENVDDNEAMRQWLTATLGTKKLAAFVISHFHPDHCGCINTVAQNFCDANTRFYMQMEVPQNTTSDDLGYYLEKLQVFTDAANAAGSIAQIPVQAHTYQLDKLALDFSNCNVQYVSLYETVQKSDNGYNNDNISINNYSLITRVSYAGSSYTNVGDVEAPAQYENAINVQPSTFASYPHHGVNMMGYYGFFSKLVTNVYHLTQSLDVQTGSIASISASVKYSYLNRYAHQIQMPIIFDNSLSMKCVMHAGDIVSITGNEFKVADTRDNDNNVPLISNVLPKASVFIPTGANNMIDNPYIIQTYDLETVLKESSEIGKDVSFHFNPAYDYIKTMNAYTKAIDIFNWNAENNYSADSNAPLIYYTSGNPATVYLGDINSVMNMFYYSTSFVSGNFPNTQWKPAFPVSGSVRKIENLNLTQGNSTTNSNAKRMFRNVNLIAELDLFDGTNHYPVNIPLNRRATNQWSGMTNISTTGWCFVEVRHTVNTDTISVNTAQWVDFAGQSVGTVTVKSIVNPVCI